MNRCKIIGMEAEHCSCDKKPLAIPRYPWNTLHYIMSGNGYFGDKFIGVGKGFACLAEDSVSYRPDPCDPWTYVWVRFDGDIPFERSEIFDFTWQNELSAICDTFLTSGMYRPRNDMHAEGLASLLLSFHSQPSRPHSPYVDSAKRYIDLNYSSKVRIGELAELLHVDRCYLRSLFTNEEGCSPQEYLMRHRIVEARKLLVSEQIGISEIARRVGYDDVLAFSRFFHSHVGISPSAYRKKYGDFS